MQRTAHGSLITVTIAYATIACAQDAPRLSLPLDCDPGRTCFIQHYVDIDTGAGVRDFRCGSATYDDHKGVDFRVLSAAAAKAGVPVIAAAPGIVKGVRDGMIDAFARETGKAGITDRECGNGMVIDHGGGWETQYCHLRQGSVLAKQGQRLERGDKLGEVGWSGLADFAHLHLSVRKDGKVIDPFSGRGQEGSCAREGGAGGLWNATVTSAFPYVNGQFLGAGLTEAVPSRAALEHNHLDFRQATVTSPMLVMFVRIANTRAGDQVRITVDGPQGFTIRGLESPFPTARQVHVAAAGKTRAAAPWPTGRYQGRGELIRDGAIIATTTLETDLK